MNTKTKPSPLNLPLRVESPHGGQDLRDVNGRMLFAFSLNSPMKPEVLAEIVRRVNRFDAIEEALRELVAWAETCSTAKDRTPGHWPMFDRARAALAAESEGGK